MEIVLVLIIFAAAMFLFVTERFPVELVSLLVLGSLLLVGLVGETWNFVDPEKWITVPEAVSGFSNPAVVTVAAMFILSAGLQKTGALVVIGRALVALGRNETILLVVTMVFIGAVSAFVNNTAAVAVFLPLVLMVCAQHNISPSRLLIPLSFASQFGGVCTLIGTSTNLLVSSISENNGLGAFSMFEFASLGVILVAAGMFYFLVAGRWLLPARKRAELTETYQLREYVTELRVLSSSPLVGKTILDSGLSKQLDLTVLEILRDKQKIWSPLNERLMAGDILLVRGKVETLMNLRAKTGLEIEPEFKLKDAALASQELTLVEVLVAPRSRLAGRTLAETAFRWRYHAIVLALQRQGQLLREKLSDVHLDYGDALLLLLRKDDLPLVRGNDNLIFLSEMDTPKLRRGRAFTAMLIIAITIALAALRIAPILVSAILGALAMVLTRCLTFEQAKVAIDWRVIFLLAGVLPLGIALERSGGAMFLAQYTLGQIGQFGPLAVLAAVYLLTAVLTECMSNNAAAVLVAPIAISTAVGMGISPKPLLMAVTFAASTSFATPVGYQTNTMVYGPGGYRFADFIKVGLPLILIFWMLSVYFIPKFWPF